MGEAKNKILAALIFLFGIVITYVAYDLILVLPTHLNNTLQLMIFWTGLISVWVTTIILTPLYLAIAKHDINEFGIAKGIGIFITGITLMIIGWNMLPDIFTALANAGGFTITNQLEGIIWFGAILMFILTCIILPIYIIAESLQIKWETIKGS